MKEANVTCLSFAECSLGQNGPGGQLLPEHSRTRAQSPGPLWGVEKEKSKLSAVGF